MSFLFSSSSTGKNGTRAHLERMRQDPDIVKEEQEWPSEGVVEPSSFPQKTRLNVVNFSHAASATTRELVESIGGLAKLEEFTAKFYERAFADPHVDRFIREHDDHHGKRFAAWIAEKFGAGTPWSNERAARPSCPFSAKGYAFDSASDRSSAHFAAWHSPKREPEKWGRHFNLDDCRRWMRLHFWAARDVGLLDTPFGEYYVKFIAHFVSVYERTAPPFAREAARWSADPDNITRYLDTKDMPDIMGLDPNAALRQLPPHEQAYTGSGAQKKLWPYD